MNLQYTVKFLKQSLPTLLQEFQGTLQVYYILSVYFWNNICRLRHINANNYASLGLNLKVPVASFTSKCSKNI